MAGYMFDNAFPLSTGGNAFVFLDWFTQHGLGGLREVIEMYSPISLMLEMRSDIITEIPMISEITPVLEMRSKMGLESE